MTNENDQLERIGNLLEKYLISFGQARAAFYVFPSLENHNDFPKYLNSFTSALKRANCRPVYSWSYDAARGCYNMILIVQGYFRNNMDDVTDAAQRIWRYYSPFPIQFVAEIPVLVVLQFHPCHHLVRPLHRLVHLKIEDADNINRRI